MSREYDDDVVRTLASFFPNLLEHGSMQEAMAIPANLWRVVKSGGLPGFEAIFGLSQQLKWKHGQKTCYKQDHTYDHTYVPLGKKW